MAAISWTKICCAVDFSDASRAAARAAADLAQRFGAELTLLHVGQGEDAQLTTAVQQARAAGAARVTSIMESGDPAARIVEYAQKGGYDLIVMGTRGRTGRALSMAGSVAETVVRRATCPVLTLHEGWRK